MPAASLPLPIDLESEAGKIENHIQELLNGHGAEGIVIGLSGGVDSAVVAALAVRASGRERVFAYYLYDRDSSKESRAKARLVADWLGIVLEQEDIMPAMREMGIYSALALKVTSISGFLNRFLNGRLHRALYGEPSFVSTLRRGTSGVGRIKRFFYRRTVGAVETAFNARHVYRRRFLEEKAGENNRVVLGAANKSEWMVGYFVKGGIDDMPFSPIIGLYKTQVRQLAKYLNLPDEIQNQVPSPDMMKGLTDESAMGISYDRLDIILDCIDRGVSDEEIAARGIREKDVRLVRTMNNLSQWKREP
jgi:NAD+ synthase